MHRLILFSVVLLFATHNALSQSGRGTMAQNEIIRLSGVSICKTTIAELHSLADDFLLVSVEEMDLPKNCFSQDSRFSNGEGYASAKFPGMIFQRGNQSDYIGKIRLTRAYEGLLPDGKDIVLKNLTLANVFTMYPAFKDQWFSRGCSDYWRFSNDTLAFFVKIDKNIQPQFPINEDYYLDKPVEAIDIVVSCYGVYHRQQATPILNANEPLFFLDDMMTDRMAVEKVASHLAFINVLKDANAVRAAGPEGINGVIYAYTGQYVRSKYWGYFKSISPIYAGAVPSLKKERGAVYILDGTVLEKNNMELKLFNLVGKDIQLQMMKKKELKKKFNLRKKKTGILITTQEM